MGEGDRVGGVVEAQDEPASLGFFLNVGRQLVVGRPGETGQMGVVFDPAVDRVVRSDIQRVRAERFFAGVVQPDSEALVEVAVERGHHIRRIVDLDDGRVAAQHDLIPAVFGPAQVLAE